MTCRSGFSLFFIVSHLYRFLTQLTPKHLLSSGNPHSTMLTKAVQEGQPPTSPSSAGGNSCRPRCPLLNSDCSLFNHYGSWSDVGPQEWTRQALVRILQDASQNTWFVVAFSSSYSCGHWACYKLD